MLSIATKDKATRIFNWLVIYFPLSQNNEKRVGRIIIIIP